MAAVGQFLCSLRGQDQGTSIRILCGMRSFVCQSFILVQQVLLDRPFEINVMVMCLGGVQLNGRRQDGC